MRDAVRSVMRVRMAVMGMCVVVIVGLAIAMIVGSITFGVRVTNRWRATVHK